MENDLNFINQKIRAAKKLPARNPKEYNLRNDIIRHWEGELYKLRRSIVVDHQSMNRWLSKHLNR